MERGLTIVVPVYNRNDMVTRTLDGIAAGVKRPRRLVVVDNGSTDGSFETCREWCSSHCCDDFETLFVSEARSGAAIARNTGMREVQTEYVYFFDSDDIFDAEAVADIMEQLERSKPDLLFLPVWQEVGRVRHVRAYTRNAAPHVHIINSMLSTVSMVFRTSWLRDIGGWDETLTTWDDWELGCRSLLNTPKMSWLTRRAYHHVYVHADSLTGISLSTTAAATARAMRQVAADIDAASLASYEEKKKCRNALYYRCCINLGKLKEEADAESSAVSVYESLQEELGDSVSPLTRITGRLLDFSSSGGIRGAWRMALQMV